MAEKRVTREAQKGVRLAKLMAERGVASRRAAEEMIAAGRVTVNGAVAAVVTFVDPHRDAVAVDGKLLPAKPPQVYYLMYKPRGYITAREDPQGRRSVLDLVGDLPVRMEPVGRLDYDTEGALLLTNDGQLANRLTHPSREVPKRYIASVEGVPDAADIRAIEKGVDLEDGRTAPARARLVAAGKEGARIEITVTEGRNRLVRRMLLQIGHPVRKLRRESFARIAIRGMKRGEVRPLTDEEVQRLRDVASGKRG
jgi:pseudouridine synthase